MLHEFLDVRRYGFARVAAVIPRVFLAQPQKNLDEHLRVLEEVGKKGAMYAVCPELGLTGYSNGDLFFSSTLITAAKDALQEMCRRTSGWSMMFTVGVPLEVGGQLYNCAVTIYRGRVVAVAPKSYLPEYHEFYERRHFARAAEALQDFIMLFGYRVPFGNNIIISEPDSRFALHTEVCEDLWEPIPPSTLAALAGATVLANLSASNITIGKHEYRQELVTGSSARNFAVQLYCAAGFGESTTDHAWDGDAMIASRGKMVAQIERFRLDGGYIISDVDLDELALDRRKSSFRQNAADIKPNFRTVTLDGCLGLLGNDDVVYGDLLCAIDPHPFVPSDLAKRDERCRETFEIQATSLARKLFSLPDEMRRLIIGVSGGQDSTHALLVAVRAMDILGLSRKNIIAITMPGPGTTDRTKGNAQKLCEALGVTFLSIPIDGIVSAMFTAIGHDTADRDVTYQNVQAWARKYVELAKAAQVAGIDLGTGDLSEAMVGWCTMFGDHSSHYHINQGVPKTLISFLIGWTADVIYQAEPEVQAVLRDILATPISPELLPADAGQMQRSEDFTGPYELVDFYGLYFVRWGFGPEKIARLALHAFGGKYTLAEIKKWLKNFIFRFFIYQLKRSCMPDGPKVGLTALSPRGDWRMPSDVSPELWLEACGRIPDTL